MAPMVEGSSGLRTPGFRSLLGKSRPLQCPYPSLRAAKPPKVAELQIILYSSSPTALLRSLGRNGLDRNAQRSRSDAPIDFSLAFPEIVKIFKSGVNSR